MSKVIIKDVSRKTTIPKAAIKKAAKIAYSNIEVADKLSAPKPKSAVKADKAA